jgi:hypothetical protein
MVIERPPLTDDEFLSDQDVPATDARIWLGVRRALAKSCGVPPSAVYPSDLTRDLMRMQFPLPDILEIRLRLEREFAIKVPQAPLEAAFGPRSGDAQVRDFAAAVAMAIRSSDSSNHF